MVVLLVSLLLTPMLSMCQDISSSSILSGGVYYVAPWGDDDNPGTIDKPWRTIGKAADTLEAGDTVYIREGVYYERVIPRYSGTQGSYITYAAFPGENATISGKELVYLMISRV